MRIALVSPPFTGHLDPILSLGACLAARGHDVCYFGQVDTLKHCERFGILGKALGQSRYPAGSLAQQTRVLGRPALLGMPGVIRGMADQTRMLLDELPDALIQWGANHVVSDQLEAAGGLVARKLALPFATLACALPINSEPRVPPYFTGWGAGQSAWEQRRNRSAQESYERLLRPLNRLIEAAAERWGLGPLRSCEDCLSPVLDLVSIPDAFDFPRFEQPRGMTYVGPLRSPAPYIEGTPALQAFLDNADDASRPVAFVSFGTLFGNRVRALQRVAHALVDCGLSPVIAHGGRLTAKQVAGFPSACFVADFVPQRAVLARARLAVGHGGMNTTMDALAAGVPIIVLPFAFDQKAVGRRVSFHECGRVLAGALVSQRQCVRAIEASLGGAFDQGVQRMSDAISRAGGVAAAADAVERL